jgi:hypothetical protein
LLVSPFFAPLSCRHFLVQTGKQLFLHGKRLPLTASLFPSTPEWSHQRSKYQNKKQVELDTWELFVQQVSDRTARSLIFRKRSIYTNVTFQEIELAG